MHESRRGDPSTPAQWDIILAKIKNILAKIDRIPAKMRFRSIVSALGNEQLGAKGD